MRRGLAEELAARNITVNCISPGYIDTKRDHIPAHFRERPVPLQRPGRPEEVAAAVRYLCGPSARFITGHTLQITGGWYMAWMPAGRPATAGSKWGGPAGAP